MLLAVGLILLFVGVMGLLGVNVLWYAIEIIVFLLVLPFVIVFGVILLIIYFIWVIIMLILG